MPGLPSPYPLSMSSTSRFTNRAGRCAVHDVVVKGDRQVEHVARYHTLLDDGWLASDAADDQKDRLPGRRQAPATAATGHA